MTPKRLTFLILMCSVLFLATETSAQCVKCVAAPPGWMCMSGGIGGDGCITEGISCTLIGTCPSRGGLASGDQSCDVKVLKRPLISISSDLIRQVSLSDARLAMALASVREIRSEFTEAKISFAPVELSKSDVEARLRYTGVKYFEMPEFKALKAKTRAAVEDKLDPIVYTIKIDTLGYAPILVIEREGDTKLGPTLDIVLSRGQRNGTGELVYTAQTWISR